MPGYKKRVMPRFLAPVRMSLIYSLRSGLINGRNFTILSSVFHVTSFTQLVWHLLHYSTEFLPG